MHLISEIIKYFKICIHAHIVLRINEIHSYFYTKYLTKLQISIYFQDVKIWGLNKHFFLTFCFFHFSIFLAFLFKHDAFGRLMRHQVRCQLSSWTWESGAQG